MRLLRLLALAAALLLGGCSAARLAYENADLYLRWQATSYLDVHGADSEALDAHVAAFLAWHRAQALPRYAELVLEARRRVLRGLSPEDLLWGYDSVRAQARQGLRAAAVEVAPLLDRLGAEQIAHLEQRLQDDNRRFAREFLAGTPQERRQRRLRRTIERLEDWLGPLNEAQRERVRRYNERTPLWDAVREESRRRMQAEFLEVVRAREARRRLPELAERLVPAREADRGAEYFARSRLQQAEYSELLIDLDRTLSAEQRRRAAERLAAYAEDFSELARRKGTGKP